MRSAVSIFRTLSPKLEPRAMASTRSPVLFATNVDRARLGALSDLTETEEMILESVRNIPADWMGRIGSKFHRCKIWVHMDITKMTTR